MTNKARQASLQRNFGTTGIFPHCLYCEKCKNKEIAKNPAGFTGNNCSHNFSVVKKLPNGQKYLCSPGEPCATAYNRMVRADWRRRGMLWQSKPAGTNEPAKKEK